MAETPETEDLVAPWADEMIELEARKAYPEELDKETIQTVTGIGPGDLRAVLERMLEAGSLDEGDAGGYVYVDPEERVAIGQPRLAVDPEADAEADGGEVPPGALGGPETGGGVAVDAQMPRYRAFILVEVEFQPERDEDEEPDDAALREAQELLVVSAANGVLEDYPGLGVKPQLVKLESFGVPRQVYPE